MSAKSGPRRIHSPELKSRVIEQCRQSGASVASVALANGLNTNMVRNWLAGRGLKRAGSAPPDGMAVGDGAVARPSGLQFVPVRLTPPSSSAADRDDGVPGEPAAVGEHISIELHRGATRLTVRWPASQAEHCASWMRELAPSLT